MLFLLKEANHRKPGFPYKETPHYSSKVMCRQNNRPFDRLIDLSVLLLAVKAAYRNVSQHCIRVVVKLKCTVIQQYF